MNAVMEAREPSAKYLSALQPPLVQHFELMATAAGGVAQLRELILALAVQGKLVEQDPRDEPASVLRQQIRAEKDRLIAEGKSRRDKPQQEISDEEQPFHLPNHWEWVRLPEVTYSLGQGAPTKQFTYIDVAAIHNKIGTVTDALEVIDSADAPSRARKNVSIGTVLYSTVRPYLKNIAVVEKEYQPIAIASTAFAVMQPHSGLHPKYLFFYLRSTIFTDFVSSKAVGIAYPAINDANFFQGVIALPPFTEQARIVARVEELMRLCDALETQGQLESAQHAQLVRTLLGTLTDSANADELAANWQRVATHFDTLLDRPEAIDALEQTILQLAVRGLLVSQDPRDEPASQLLKRLTRDFHTEALPNRSESGALFAIPSSWIWVSLERLTSSMANGLYKPAKFYRDSGVVCVRMYNIQDGHLDLTKFMRLDVTSSELAQYCLKPGDLLINRVNSRELVGKCAVVSAYHEPLVYEAMNIRVRLVETEIMPSYVNLVLRTKRIRDLFQGDAKQAVGQASINQGQVGGAKIPLPPLREQARIVSQVDSLRRLCTDLRQRLVARQTTQAHLAEALIAEVA